MQDAQARGSSVPDGSQTILDRPADLTAIPAEWIAWTAVLLSACGIRLIGRTNWPLSPDESAIALDAFTLVQGNDLSYSAASHPAVVQLTGLMFFLFGDTDYAARLVPLFAGIGVVVVLFWFRKWAGNLPALSAAVIWTVSPVMTMGSLRLDGGMPLVFATLTILALVFAISVEPSAMKSALLGVALALAITVHPLGWIFGPLALLLAALMVRDPEFSGRLRHVLLGFGVSLIVIISHFGTRPGEATGFFVESWSTLWSRHLETVGTDWHLTVLALLIEEPLALVMASIGLVLVLFRSNWNTTVPPALVIAGAVWAIPAITLGLILGGKSPALYSVSIFPLILLAGFGLSMVIEGTIAAGYQWRRIALAVLLGIVVLVALVRFIDLVSRGRDGDTTGWIVSALVLGLLVIVPIGAVTLRMVRSLGLAVVPMSLLAVALILGVVGLRSSLLLPATATERPGELLVDGSSAPSVTQVVDRLRTYSRDATTYDQDVRDPTGGHGLTIAVERDLAEPFAWYFRDFPNLVVVDGPEDLDPEAEPDVVIADPDSSERYVQELGSYGTREYAGVYRIPDSLRNPSIATGVFRLLNPQEFRESFRFLVYRETETPSEVEEFSLILHEEHASVVWGTSSE